MACSPCTSANNLEQFKCWLDELKIVYTDCDGVVHGDCGMCAGQGDGETQTNTIAFNPGSNMITSIVDGIASSALLSFDTSDITLASPLTINSVLYPQGTTLQTILAAIVSFGHPAASVAGGSNPALTVNTGTQVFNLDLTAPGSYDNTTSGLVADNVQDAIDELVSTVTGLPSGNIGEILVHNGTDFTQTLPVIEEFTGLTGAVINLANAPVTYPVDEFVLLRNGMEVSAPGDYSRVGQVVTLTSAAIASEIFTAKYYV